MGNPPFGQQGRLAVAFINHAFSAVGADTVAFILPRGFRKESVRARLFAYAALADEVLLDADAFLLNGAAYNVPSVFQVWRRSSSARALPVGALTSRFASFTSAGTPADLCVRRVGGRAGAAFIPSEPPSAQSNYFLTLTGSHTPPVGEVVALINDLDFAEARDGTGPNTLSKREFVRRFDAACAQTFPAWEPAAA